MSYSSLNELSPEVKIKDVIEFVSLLGFEYQGTLKSEEVGAIKCFYWFDSSDYKSWVGVELSVYENNETVMAETNTPMGRSYYDLEKQNHVIRSLRKYFGGTFETDEGKGRYLHPGSGPPTPAASGCHLAFQRFGSNLHSAKKYFDKRQFEDSEPKLIGKYWLDNDNPWLISNNLLVPFLVSIFEDYWKSTYIALLKFSKNKEKVMKSGRISSDRLVEISEGCGSVEQAFAETISFQRISMVCTHFKSLDSKLDFSKVLHKPYRGRKISLYDSLEEVTDLRNRIVHEAEVNRKLTDKCVEGIFHDLSVGMINCYKHLTKIYGWVYDKRWSGKF